MTQIFRLKDIACPDCALKIENAISKINYVESVNLDYLSEKLIIKAKENKFKEIIPEVKKICKEIDPHTIFVSISNNNTK